MYSLLEVGLLLFEVVGDCGVICGRCEGLALVLGGGLCGGG